MGLSLSKWTCQALWDGFSMLNRLFWCQNVFISQWNRQHLVVNTWLLMKAECWDWKFYIFRVIWRLQSNNHLLFYYILLPFSAAFLQSNEAALFVVLDNRHRPSAAELQSWIMQFIKQSPTNTGQGYTSLLNTWAVNFQPVLTHSLTEIDVMSRPLGVAFRCRLWRKGKTHKVQMNLHCKSVSVNCRWFKQMM